MSSLTLFRSLLRRTALTTPKLLPRHESTRYVLSPLIVFRRLKWVVQVLLQVFTVLLNWPAFRVLTISMFQTAPCMTMIQRLAPLTPPWLYEPPWHSVHTGAWWRKKQKLVREAAQDVDSARPCSRLEWIPCFRFWSLRQGRQVRRRRHDYTHQEDHW